MKEIATALAKAQSTMSGAKRTKKNPFFKSSYADLESVFEAIREPFAENGLSVTQIMEVLDNGNQVLITRLMHESGEFLDSKMLVPNIQDIQKLGGAYTYLRRYALMAIAGIPAEDDDGNEASQEQKKQAQWISKDKYEKMMEFIEPYPDLVSELKRICKVSDLRRINEAQFQACSKFSKNYIEKREAEAGEVGEDLPSDIELHAESTGSED